MLKKSYLKMEEKYFCSQQKGKKFAKGIPQEKAKIRKKYSLRKGKDSQKVFLKKRQSFAKVFSVFQYYEERVKLFEQLTRDGKKRDFQVQNILLSKNFMTMLDLTLEAFAISLLLASGSVRGKSQGQHLGRSSVFCTTAPRLCWSNTAPEARERPLILGNKYKHHIR